MDTIDNLDHDQKKCCSSVVADHHRVMLLNNMCNCIYLKRLCRRMLTIITIYFYTTARLITFLHLLDRRPYFHHDIEKYLKVRWKVCGNFSEVKIHY